MGQGRLVPLGLDMMSSKNLLSLGLGPGPGFLCRTGVLTRQREGTARPRRA
jgi:hypothetical protein